LVKLYESRKEAMTGLDLTALRGRKIVIDPGHGGVFRGARGGAGLDEADVNLGVALYLWGLLEEAGAQVVLTRKSDRDFVGGDSLSLADDLRARTEIVNRVEPDIFMSLHHNAGLAVDTTFNEIQIYFKMQDKGPSLDVARIIAEHLRMNLGETRTRVLPGNYHVLRNSNVPSILCEPSYITNRQVESKLKLADKQRLEAEVYFIALADYFSRGIPYVADFGPLHTQSSGLALIEVEFDPLVLLDPSTLTINLDGTALRPFRLGLNHFGALPPQALQSGLHTVRASGRSIKGNSSPEAVWSFRVRTEPALLSLFSRPSHSHPVFPQKISAVVLDRNGNPVGDSTSVVFSWGTGSVERPTMGGKTAVYVNREVPFGQRTILVTCGSLDERIQSLPGERAADHSVTGFVTTADGEPIEGGRVAGEEENAWTLSDDDGYFAMWPGTFPDRLHISKQGYRDQYIEVREDTYPRAVLARFYSAMPPEAAVTIDPRGGGDDTGWVGPSGTPASDLNLAVARRLAALLASAGISSHLTREADRRIAPQDRVTKCEYVKSTLVVSIGHSGGSTEGVTIGHYPGSRGGISLSRYLSEELGPFMDTDPCVGETDDYIVLQTSCPAVTVDFKSGVSLGKGAAVSTPSAVWDRAYGMFCAVVRYLHPNESETFSVTGRVICSTPCPDVLILIDGTFEMIAAETGHFSLKLLEPGPHTAQVISAGSESERVRFGPGSGPIQITLDR
jgi:N-acetylmuramoyl-L-alanine amidase